MASPLGSALKAAREARGLSAKAVGANVNISAPAVYQWESGKTEPSTENLFATAALLGIDAEAARRGEVVTVGEGERRSPVESEVRPAPDLPDIRTLARTRGPKVPVLGIAVGGDDGDFTFNGETINFLSRPAALEDAKGIYALFVSNQSMKPLFADGDPIFVDSKRHPSIGDCVVIELKPSQDGEPGAGFIKELVRRSASTVVVRQYNPEKELTFDMREVKAIHRVIPWRELLGI